jgi:hypothetical protein
MAKNKTVEDVPMSFVDSPGKPEETADDKTKKEKSILGDNPEILEDNGKRVLGKNKDTKEMMFWDADGNEIDMEILDRIQKGYPESPEYNANDSPKKGELKVRFTKEVRCETPEDRKKFGAFKTIECPEAECDVISERQDYEDGDAHIVSIPKKFHSLVKLVRGQIG